MGYPYAFEELVVVDLPQDDRNELYKEDDDRHVVDSALGPVHYRYHSMADLSAYPEASFDLVFSGQSIEHVPVDEADKVLGEVARVLRPGGHLALDTPNATVCRLQQAEFIDPDHEHEYTHGEMSDKLRANGFEILEAKGLNHAGRSLAAGVFSAEDVANHPGPLRRHRELLHPQLSLPDAGDEPMTDEAMIDAGAPAWTTPTGPT